MTRKNLRPKSYTASQAIEMERASDSELGAIILLRAQARREQRALVRKLKDTGERLRDLGQSLILGDSAYVADAVSFFGVGEFINVPAIQKLIEDGRIVRAKIAMLEEKLRKNGIQKEDL